MASIPSLSKSSTQKQHALYYSSFAVVNTIPSDLHVIEDPLLFKANCYQHFRYPICEELQMP